MKLPSVLKINYDADSETFLSSSAAKILRDNRNAKRIAEGIERQAVVIANNHTAPHGLMDVNDDVFEPEHPTIRDVEVGTDAHSDENELNSLNTRLCTFSTDTDDQDDPSDDTFESRIDLEKINSIKSKHSNSKRDRKESFEQRLKRTFTIKDEHTSEVTKRIVALVIKYSLFVFNFLSWVMATAAIVSGIWINTDNTIMITTSGTDFFLDPPLMMCIGGGITFIVAFLGCVGALRENLILLKVFFYVLTFILFGEIVIACGVFVIYVVPEARENFLRSKPEQILRSAIHKYMDDADIKTWLDRIQSEFKCCGISHTDEGFRDWKESPYFNCTPSNKSIFRCAVPTSCCIFEKGDRVNTMCGFDMTDKPLIEVRDYIHTRGCIQGFGEWLGKYDDLIIISCLTIFIMQSLAVLSAKLMVIRIRKQRARWRVIQRPSTESSTSTAGVRSTL